MNYTTTGATGAAALTYPFKQVTHTISNGDLVKLNTSPFQLLLGLLTLSSAFLKNICPSP